MEKRKIHWEFVKIPFKEKFSHNSASRHETETIIIKIQNLEGTVGFGESCPRYYVTGESFSTAYDFYGQFKSSLENIFSLAELKEFVFHHKAEIDKNPAAWCALELALLDLMAKERLISVEQLLGVKKQKIPLPFTAVIGIDSFPQFLKKAIKYRLLGFLDFKIKLSGHFKQDRKALSLLKHLGCKKSNIRVDGNNLWKNKTEAINYLRPLLSYIWAIEEPIKANEFQDMAEMAHILNLKIILDESMLNLESFSTIQNKAHLFIPNIRISKLGGVLRTLELINYLEKNNFQWILGSHVGEMSLLTRASLLIASEAKPNSLIAREGAFSTHLILEDLFYPNLKLGLGACIKLNAPYSKFGWEMNYQKKES
jgi:L-alanine-DL-glutamate epimerase-like enolase superfamily enzyme